MRYSWIIHAVKDETLKEGMVDVHTHGLDKFGSLELQFVIFCDGNTIGYFLNTVGEMIQNGLKLYDGMMLEGLCDDEAKIKVFKTYDAFGEEIFRLILPDAQFRFPEDSDEWPYNLQYESPYKDRKSSYLS